MDMRADDALTLLQSFEIETPSWGYADTGTRFGKFFQDAAAGSIEEKFADAATVHEFSGLAPAVALHAAWDFGTSGERKDNAERVMKAAGKAGVTVGTINPNLFEDQAYKYGSASSPFADAREMADRHVRDCLDYAALTHSPAVNLWFGDGTNYPGQDNIVARKRRMTEALKAWHGTMPEGVTMLVEYKPFEPAFYHSDIADWGMAAAYARAAGPRAKVLVDTGHHCQGANIEHIVAFLIDEGLLGGFHFNDRKYADDDLTLGSIDPYAVFRIFHEIVTAVEEGRARLTDIGFCVDQSHNLKPKIEAMLQTVVVAQELFFKACLVDRRGLAGFQAAGDIVGAERCLTAAFNADVEPMLAEFRAGRNVAADPIEAYRSSGHEAKLAKERGARNRAKRVGSSYA
jgi:L-rhamnose isomerase/sugar isomerase